MSKNTKCPYCHKELEYGEDIVVCPGCSKAYHKKCWEENQGCVTESCYGEAMPAIIFAGGEEDGSQYARAPVETRFLAYIIDTTFAKCIIIANLIFYSLYIGTEDVDKFTNYSLIYQFVNTFILGRSKVQGNMAIFIVVGFIGVIWYIIYFLIKDGLINGQSIGKHITGLITIDLKTNKPCNMRKSILRNLSLLIFTFTLIGVWIDALLIIFERRSRRIGDYMANTCVISAKEYAFGKTDGASCNRYDQDRLLGY